MSQTEKLLDTARGEIGYTEGRNNDTKYGAEYGMNNVPWCCIFVWWVFRTAGLSDLFYGGERVASCTAVMNYAKDHGQWVTGDYRPGDIILYQFDNDSYADHIGICESAGGSAVTCIEGNTSKGSSGSQSNGDGVYRRERRLSLVYGAYRPEYKEETPGGAENGAAEVIPGVDDSEEAEEMTYEDFKTYMERYIAELAAKPEPEWSINEGAWQRATEAGVVNGEAPERPIKRDEMAAVLDRLGLLK